MRHAGIIQYLQHLLISCKTIGDGGLAARQPLVARQRLGRIAITNVAATMQSLLYCTGHYSARYSCFPSRDNNGTTGGNAAYSQCR